jgi:hypothetical protein
LPQYDNIKELKWSNGWLEGFKKRYKIKEYIQHREASSTVIDNPNNIIQIEALRYLYTKYKLCNILNIDKTSLNWKRTPDCMLIIKSHSRTKKSKDHITITLTSNTNSSKKFLPWVISKSENPRCFSKINRNNLQIIYRFNKSK